MLMKRDGVVKVVACRWVIWDASSFLRERESGTECWMSYKGMVGRNGRFGLD